MQVSKLSLQPCGALSQFGKIEINAPVNTIIIIIIIIIIFEPFATKFSIVVYHNKLECCVTIMDCCLQNQSHSERSYSQK